MVELTKTGTSKAVVRFHDGGQDGAKERTIYTQKIGYTDFPWDSFMVYVGQGDETSWVVMLPSEY